MNQPAPPDRAPAADIRKVLAARAEGIRDDRRTAEHTGLVISRVRDALWRAVELQLIDWRGHLTDSGRAYLGGPTHWRTRRDMAAVRASESANSPKSNSCSCGSCVVTGLMNSEAPYYPLSLREGR